MDTITFLLLVLAYFPAMVWSHARLMSPPSRSSMWRLGFPTKKNFNDNALYCGGISIQWQKNGGKCGICGDPYHMPHPRDNEAGGKYGRGIISMIYQSGQVIEATVDVTTNHRGYFEFKLCPNNNPKKEATQECLDKYVLKEAHGTGVRYYIGDKERGNVTVKLQLPKGLICSQCVFQWTYVAGNNWGRCKDGTSRLGCGPQETFRGCADIAIKKNSEIFNVKFNENDVESKHSEDSHKNRKHGHSKGTTKIQDTDNEMPKHGGKNINESNSTINHNHQQNTGIHQKNGDYLPPLSPKPEAPKRKIPFFNRQHHHRFVNRRKSHKFNNRYFYHHMNHPAIRQNPTGEVFPMDNSWITDTRHASSFNTNRQQHGNKWHNAERPLGHYTHRRDLPINFIHSGEDDSLYQGFNLGGRRYKDFWLL